MKTRIISGIMVVVIMLALVWAGGVVLTAGLCLISSIGFLEMTKALGIRDKSDKIHILEIIGVIANVFYYALIYLRASYGYLMLYVMLILPLFMMITVFTFPGNNSKQAISGYFSFVYVAVMLSFVLMTRLVTGEEEGFYTKGFYAVWMTFISAWGSDTCAYFTGVFLGRHKAFPNLSPKKSVEGCIGGVLGAGFFGLLYAYVLRFAGHDIPGGWLIYPLLGVAGSILGQIGDLAASAIKRDHGIKDYGKCIPGHGGILDRYDSIIFTCPMIYLLTITFL